MNITPSEEQWMNALQKKREYRELLKQPEVQWQLTMPPLPSHKRVPVDTDEYRRQVDTAFQHAERGWDAVYGISSDLYEITATAAHFAQQRDHANAATIYEVVAWETLSYYESYHDEDGAQGHVVQECIEGLGACLENELGDETLIQQILTAIFTIYRFDVDHGGSVFTKDVPPEFLQSTTPEERFAEWLKNHHVTENNLAAALEIAEFIFRRRPCFTEYQKVHELALQLGT